ncbi:YeeE/YedE thiosulfate transporter family protein [Cupriavidus sp. CP313]
MASASFLIAAAAVGLMGFANQRGGTCTVSAIEEFVATRRVSQLAALVEASLWVGGGLVLLNAFGVLPAMPVGYAAGALTIVGGVLFGAGAFVNRACEFGTVARLGKGELAYLFTPVGFYLGSLAAAYLPTPQQLARDSIVLAASSWLAVLVVALVAIRLSVHALRIHRSNRSTLDHIWSPHVATTVIGVTFLVALMAAGNWTYTELLSDLARGAELALPSRLLLYITLLGGAVLGGCTAGRIQFVVPSVSGLVRCLFGGVMMGIGGTLIPGGNTGLVLVGMPLLWPHAWLAFASICITIYFAIRITRFAGATALRTRIGSRVRR